MIKCQHKNEAAVCSICAEIQRRQDLDNAMHRKGSAGGASLVHHRTPREEANALIKIIDAGNSDDKDVSSSDLVFLDSIKFQMKDQDYQPTPKQIFWLRDIRDRCL